MDAITRVSPNAPAVADGNPRRARPQPFARVLGGAAIVPERHVGLAATTGPKMRGLAYS
jgi:hypothetical protein